VNQDRVPATMTIPLKPISPHIKGSSKGVRYGRKLALERDLRDIVERRIPARRLDCNLIFHRGGKLGEHDVPEGLKKAMANTNALQDALTLRAGRSGRAAGEAHDATMAEMARWALRRRSTLTLWETMVTGLGQASAFEPLDAVKRSDKSRGSATTLTSPSS